MLIMLFGLTMKYNDCVSDYNELLNDYKECKQANAEITGQNIIDMTQDTEVIEYNTESWTESLKKALKHII